jgi:hypothetical protein
MPLVDTGLFARYYLDEAGSGTGPTVVNDSGPNAYHLNDVVYGSTLSWVTEAGGQRGLHSTTAGQAVYAKRRATTSDALVQLSGGKKWTIEIVAVNVRGTDSYERVVALHPVTHTSVSPLSIVTSAGYFIGSFGNKSGGTFVVDGAWGTTSLAVFHLVIDSTQATVANRAVWYRNGTIRTNGSVNTVPLDQTLTLDTDYELLIFNRHTYNRSPTGTILYAAVYADAMTAADIENNATILLANSDSPVPPPALELYPAIQLDTGSYVRTASPGNTLEFQLKVWDGSKFVDPQKPPIGTTVEVAYIIGGDGLYGNTTVQIAEGGISATFLPRRWKRQPQGPVGIDWGNRLTHGLTDAFDFRRIDTPNLIARTRQQTQRNSSLAMASGAAGRGIRFPGGSTAGHLAVGAGDDYRGLKQTWLVVARVYAVAVSNAVLVGKHDSNGSWDGWNISTAIGTPPLSVNLQLKKTDATEANLQIPTPDLRTIPWFAAAGAFDTANLWLAFNGRTTPDESLGGGTMSITNTESLHFGSSPDPWWSTHNGIIFAAFGWTNRALSRAELAEVTHNPWQLFTPAQRRIYSLGRTVVAEWHHDPAPETDTRFDRTFPASEVSDAGWADLRGVVISR